MLIFVRAGARIDMNNQLNMLNLLNMLKLFQFNETLCIFERYNNNNRLTAETHN